ncbi:lipase [Folsomia candida]|nr:lipase [Folsomia candida]
MGSTVMKRNKTKGEAPVGEEMRIHTGFIIATNSLYSEVVEKLGSLLKEKRDHEVVAIGHSLGAAIASVTLFMIKEEINLPPNFPTPKSYAYFGYGTPRVGNKAYADYWNGQKDMHITRVVNQADFAAHAPPAIAGYVHYGTELWITETGIKKCSRKMYEDPTCANSVAEAANLPYHLKYWDVAFLSCALKNPLWTVQQFVMPLSILKNNK